MTTFKEAQDYYNDTEWGDPIVTRSPEGALFVHSDTDWKLCQTYLDHDARFFNRLTLLSWYIPLLVLAAVALWLSVLPGVVAGAILGGLLVLAVNNVEEALG